MGLLMDNVHIDINQDEILENANNYTALNLAYLIENQKDFNEMQFRRMITESMWMKTCMQSGFILPITEAETDNTNVTKPETTTDTKNDNTNKTKLSSKVKEWIDAFINRIISDVSSRYQEYGPWVSEYKDDLLAAASKADNNLSFRIVPYHQTDYKAQSSTCVSAINKGINNIRTGNSTDYSYANPILDSKHITENSANMNTYILNYFRTGKKNVSDIDKVVISKTELPNFVNTAIVYITKYKTEVTNNIKKISNAYQKLDTIKTPNTESVNPDMYLITEDKLLSESVLSTLINYNVLLEAGEGNKTTDNTNDNKVEAKVDGEKKSPTNIEQVDANGKPKDNDTTNQTAEKEKAGNADAYTNTFKKFATSVIADYARVCDERMILYANILIQVAKSANIPTPTKDKNGNVTYKKREEKTETKEKK